MKNKIIIGGLITGALGVFLLYKGIVLVPARCWGAAGCSYYTHDFGPLAYCGSLLVLIGVLLAGEGILSRHASMWLRMLIAIVMCILGLIGISIATLPTMV